MAADDSIQQGCAEARKSHGTGASVQVSFADVADVAGVGGGSGHHSPVENTQMLWQQQEAAEDCDEQAVGVSKKPHGVKLSKKSVSVVVASAKHAGGRHGLVQGGGLSGNKKEVMPCSILQA